MVALACHLSPVGRSEMIRKNTSPARDDDKRMTDPSN